VKSREALIQFQTEARIGVSRTRTCRVYDYFSLPGAHYIVMEYITADARTGPFRK
jgi:hypothetical protein